MQKVMYLKTFKNEHIINIRKDGTGLKVKEQVELRNWRQRTVPLVHHYNEHKVVA